MKRRRKEEKKNMHGEPAIQHSYFVVFCETEDFWETRQGTEDKKETEGGGLFEGRRKKLRQKQKTGKNRQADALSCLPVGW